MERAANKKIVRCLLACVCLFLGLSGCSSGGSSGKSADQAADAAKAALLKRSQTFWDAKAITDTAGSYKFLEPEWKAKLSPAQWTGSFGLVKWIEPKVVDSKIDGSFAVIAVEFDWEVMDTWVEGSKGDVTFYAYWINVGGIWYKEEPQKNKPASWDTFPERS